MNKAYVWVVEFDYGLGWEATGITGSTRNVAREKQREWKRAAPDTGSRVVKYIRWNFPVKVVYKEDIKWGTP
jgi:hypothetical protein